MKKILILCLLFGLTACTRQIEQVVVVVTATPPSVTDTSLPPTNSPLPTNTPRPTRTPIPPPDPISVSDIEDALRADGHRRNPWTTDEGLSAFTWVKENPYESITTFEDGSIEIQVLHDKSQAVRDKAVERKLKVLDRVFPAGFMSRLRNEHGDFSNDVPTSVSGEPDQIFPYGDAWNTVWAQYYADAIRMDGYTVTFSLWWWQSTCPSGYFCWYDDFPGLEFTGDSSFVFYTIFLEPGDTGSLSGPST